MSSVKLLVSTLATAMLELSMAKNAVRLLAPVHFCEKRAEKAQGVVIVSSTVAARHQMEMLAATLPAKATQQRSVEVPID